MKTILDAAEKLFFERPYDAVSMDEIANVLELSKPTIYFYFKDKESLYLAIVERGLRIWLDMTRTAVNDADSGIDQLAAIGMTHRRFIKAYPEYYRVLNYFRSGRFSSDKGWENPVFTEISRIMQDFSDINDSAIQVGIEDGTLRSDMDPVVLSVLLATFSLCVNNMNPQFRKKLETRGISEDRFFNEFINMMYNMMENPTHRVLRRTRTEKADAE